MQTTQRHCKGCGYNLDLLSTAGNCPECGKPIAESLKGDWLRYASHDWLHGIARGLVWVRAGQFSVLAFLAMRILLLIVGLAVIKAGTDTAAEAVLESILLWCGYAMLISPLIATVGIWRVMSPAPGDPQRIVARQLVTRIGALIAIPAFGFWWLVGVPQSTGYVSGVEHLGIHLCMVVAWCHLIAVLRRSRQLESRSALTSVTRLQTLNGYVLLGYIVPALALIVCWLGPIRLMDQRYWSMPGAEAYRALFYAIGFAWFLAIGALANSRPAVRNELSAAKQLRT